MTKHPWLNRRVVRDVPAPWYRRLLGTKSVRQYGTVVECRQPQRWWFKVGEPVVMTDDGRMYGATAQGHGWSLL